MSDDNEMSQFVMWLLFNIYTEGRNELPSVQVESCLFTQLKFLLIILKIIMYTVLLLLM